MASKYLRWDAVGTGEDVEGNELLVVCPTALDAPIDAWQTPRTAQTPNRWFQNAEKMYKDVNNAFNNSKTSMDDLRELWAR